MRQVAVVTDSAASLPPDLRARYEIEVVPLNLVLENHAYPDGLDDNHHFYQSLKSARRPPTTTSATPGTYLEAFQRAAQRAPAVLCITVSTQFSATHDAAIQAAATLKEDLPDLQLEVLDSGSAAMGEGFVVLEAARAAADGADLPAVMARAREAIPAVGLVAVVDTLEYLARGGRVPRIQAWASALLSVKPIIELRQQSIHLLTRTRTKRRAVAQLIPILEQRGYKGGRLHLCVQHTDVLDEAEQLAAEAARRLEPGEISVSEFTLVMGAHTGPGLLGLAYYVEPNGDRASLS
ncbi:MAG: DegV family protein [Dehalococcoidia bacterium]|jgi:DegV family protein with EDD domain